MCAGPHTGRHKNEVRAGADMECGAPAPLRRGRPLGRRGASPPAGRQGLKTPGYEKRPLKGAQDAYAL